MGLILLVHLSFETTTDYFGSLFLGISTFVGYLMLIHIKSRGAIYPIHKEKYEPPTHNTPHPQGVHIFPFCPRVNIIARLEFELGYYDVTVQYDSHDASAIPRGFIIASIWWLKRKVLTRTHNTCCSCLFLDFGDTCELGTGIYLTFNRVRIWYKAILWWGRCTNRDSCKAGAKILDPIGKLETVCFIKIHRAILEETANKSHSNRHQYIYIYIYIYRSK